MKGSLFTRSFAVVSAAVLAVAVMVLTVGIAITEKVYIQSNAEGLKRAAYAAGATLPDLWADSPGDSVAAAFCAKLSAASSFRITLVDIDGRVRGDSGADPATMANHADRPEVSGALAGKASWSRRKSSTTGEWMLYAAVPLRPADGLRVTGALRLALPLPGLMEVLGATKQTLILVALASALVALAASALFIRLLSRPVIVLSDRARRYVKGNLEPRPQMKAAATAYRDDGLRRAYDLTRLQALDREALAGRERISDGRVPMISTACSRCASTPSCRACGPCWRSPRWCWRRRWC